MNFRTVLAAVASLLVAAPAVAQWAAGTATGTPVVKYAQTFTYTFADSVGFSTTHQDVSLCDSPLVTLSNASAKVELFDCRASGSNVQSSDCVSKIGLPKTQGSETGVGPFNVSSFQRGFAAVRVTVSAGGGTVSVACSDLDSQYYSGSGFSNPGGVLDADVQMVTEESTLRGIMDDGTIAVWDQTTYPYVSNTMTWVDNTGTLRSSGCTVNPADSAYVPTCPAPTSTPKVFETCEPASVGSDCMTVSAPTAGLSADSNYETYSDGKMPSTVIRRKMATISSSAALTCGGTQPTCASNDHLAFNTLVYEGDDSDIDCDTTTAYQTADGASVGRCQIKTAGTYKLSGIIPPVTFGAASNLLIVGFYDTTTPKTPIPNATTQIQPLSATTSPLVVGGNHIEIIEEWAAEEVPVWIELRMTAVIGTLTSFGAGGSLTIERLE